MLSRSITGAWVQAWISNRAVHDRGKAGLRLDIGVFDEAAFKAPLDHQIGTGQRGLGIAAAHETAAHDIACAWSGCSRAAPSASASGTVSTAGRRVQVTGKLAGSKTAPSTSASPTTAATASPRKRASVSAKTGWSTKAGITPKALRPGTSAAVRTQARPGRAASQAARSPK